jgi:P4 family phage/plasmid primase-like protien
MSAKVFDLIEDNRVDLNQYFTHIIEYDNERYKCLLNSRNLKRVISNNLEVMEVLNARIPVMSKIVSTERDFNEEDIRKLVYIQQNIIDQMYKISDDKLFTCTLYNIDCKTLYFQFPFTSSLKSTIRTVFRDALIASLESSNLVDEDANDVVDEGVYDHLWKLRDDSNVVIYEKLSDDMEDESREYSAEEFFSEFSDSLSDEMKFPLFSSNNIKTRELLKENKKFNAKEKKMNNLMTSIENQTKAKNYNDKDLAKIFLTMIDNRRFSIPMSRRDIAICIYDVYDHSREGYKLFCKYFGTDCKEEWGNLQDSKYVTEFTSKNLEYMAELDSPDRYKDWKDKVSDILIKASTNVNASHTEVARVIYHEYRTRFLCSGLKQNAWHHFKDHRYQRLDDGVTIKKKISSEIAEYFEILESMYRKELEECVDDSGKEIWSGKLERCCRLIRNLKTQAYKNNVVKECCEMFYNKDFEENKDERRELFCCKNGVLVIDMETKSIDFRAGYPEDFITLCCNNNYIEYKWSDEQVQNVIKFYEQVFVDKNIRDYFYKTEASCLKGGNDDKMLPIYAGEGGDNAKSTVQKLVEDTLGDYCAKSPSSLISGGNQKHGEATPAITRLKGVRKTFCQEIDANATMNASFVKQATGNDSLYYRGLHKEGSEFLPQFTITIVQNRDMNASSNEKALWNRIKKLPFESTFSKTAPESVSEQIKTKIFPVDKNFDAKLAKMREAFLWLLVQWFKKYMTEGLDPPKKVRDATEKYRNKNDRYLKFINENVKEDSKHNASLSNIYNSFKRWFENSYPSEKHNIPPKDDVEKYFIEKYGTPTNGHIWKGLKLTGNVLVNED